MYSLCFPWLSIKSSGYKCLDLATHKISIFHHVTFDEHTFPFSKLGFLGPPAYSFLYDDGPNPLLSPRVHHLLAQGPQSIPPTSHVSQQAHTSTHQNTMHHYPSDDVSSQLGPHTAHRVTSSSPRRASTPYLIQYLGPHAKYASV